ncbi:sulfatase [Bacteroidia bacterium]|nr:sulfatase [Bacteroidia bacterium]
MAQHLKLLTAALLPATLAGSATVATAAPAQKKKPNLVFVFADQWRKHALGYRGEDPVLTPNLDSFASWAFSFDNAVACRPVSGPDRACLMTGKYPINNGVFANSVPLAPDEQTLGDLCKSAGYKTAFIGKWHLNGDVDQVLDPSRRHGFDFWVQSVGHQPFNQRYYIGESKNPVYIKDKWAPTYETGTAIEYISRVKDGDEPFCVVLSYNPPHTSGSSGFEDRYQPGQRVGGEIKYGYGYGGPRSYEALYTGNDYVKNPIRGNVMPVGAERDESGLVVPGYFGAITAIDNDFGDLMKYLQQNGLLENTIILFTADHGESMGSQGLMTKGTWFEESAGVPFIIGWKGKTASKREKAVFNSIDVLPTLMGMMDIRASQDMDGVDFSPMLLGGSFKAPEYAMLSFDLGGVAELKSPRYWRALYSERYTYVLCGFNAYRKFTKNGEALYDRLKDPMQLSPIFRGNGQDRLMDKLKGELAAMLRSKGDPFMTDYWQVEHPGYPKLNRHTISLEEMKQKIENGEIVPNGVKKKQQTAPANNNNKK